MRKFSVNEVYRSIQGEGFWAGHPVTIVRFQGCNLRCPFCDTPYAQRDAGGIEFADAGALIAYVNSITRPTDIILLTGGEPAIQPVGDLISAWPGRCHVETNGTLPLAGFDWITISPKPPATVHPTTLAAAHELKWLIADEQSVEQLLRFLADTGWTKRVCVQPVSCDPRATEIAYHCALEFGWQLSLQLHKLIGVR